MTLTESSSPTRHRPLQRVGLVPFVAVLYAYCAGGPFGSKLWSLPLARNGFALYPDGCRYCVSVPMALATAEMASAIPVEGGFLSLESHRVRRLLGLPVRLVELDGTFLMSGAYGVMLADYIGQLAPIQIKWGHWLIAFAFLATVAYLNIRAFAW